MQIPLFDDSKSQPSQAKWAEQLLEPIPIQKDQASSPNELVPENAIVRLTNNYDFSGNLTSRFLSLLKEDEEKSSKLLQDAMADELAVPKVRIPGLINFSRKAELLTNTNQLTTLGNIYLRHDQFFLNPGGLWLLHYLISSNALAASWCRLFNSIYYEAEEVSPSDMPVYYKDLQGGTSDKTFSWNGAKELGAILRTYSDSMFKPLGMLMRVDKGQYLLIHDAFDIHPLVWLSSILAYRDRYYPGAASLETHLLVDAHFSPGRLFHQKDEIVRQALDKLHTSGLITVETRLGLDQVRFKREITWISAITRYFEDGA
jgi:hypothetical protein